MVKSSYNWLEGAELGDHSKKKHEIIRSYLNEYLLVRCNTPQQSRFRLAIVDGFAGSGAYKGGIPGSPIIFLEVLINQVSEINSRRHANGMATITFDCLLIFNDIYPEVIEILKQNVAPLIIESQENQYLNLKIEYNFGDFEQQYDNIKRILGNNEVTRNVFFNLDQCGSTMVKRRTISDILTTYKSAEVLLNISIESMLTYISISDRDTLTKTLEFHGISANDIEDIPLLCSKWEMRAKIERLVFEAYRSCGQFVSPFAINNPDGWQYWLMHFSNEPKARQVYNDLLHESPGVQGHIGRAGLNMLSFDPNNIGQEYLFGEIDRRRAREELYNDIPKAVSEFGDSVVVSEFMKSIWNETPSHSHDISSAIIDNPDLKIITENGGERRSIKGIRPTDIIRINAQKSFFFIPSFKIPPH